MKVRCDKCSVVYDDTYRLTYCPHEAFEMRTMVYQGGKAKLCCSLEELKAFLHQKDE